MTRKNFLVIFAVIVLLISNIYAEGQSDPYSPFQDLIQIKIINMTNDEIEFFYNSYYFPKKISPNDFYLTKQIPKNYKNACFFIIKNNKGKATIYNFNDTDHWFSKLHQFHIAVFDTEIKVFSASFDKEYDYSDVSLYSDFYTTSIWHKWDWKDDDKSISLVNSSNSVINVYISDAYTERKDFQLKPSEEASFEENQTLFQLRPIEIWQTYNDANSDYNNFFVYHKWYEYKDIRVIFNKKGYEIIYE